MNLSTCLLSALLLSLTFHIGAEEPASAVAESSDDAVAQDVLASLDLKTDPCQDFYRYACGGWLDSTSIPPNQPRWARSLSSMWIRNQRLLGELIGEAAQNPGQDPDRQRLGTFFASCLNEPAIAAVGSTPLAPYLEEISAATDLQSVFALAGRLHRLGIMVFFTPNGSSDVKDPRIEVANFSQDGLGLMDRDSYVSAEEEALRQAYGEHIAAMLQWVGEERAAAEHQAKLVQDLETALARASRSSGEMRKLGELVHRIDRPGLEKLAPNLPWDAYFQALGRADLVDINVMTPAFFTEFDKVLPATDIKDLRAYLRWHLINGTADLLSPDFAEANFAFFAKRLTGRQVMPPRTMQCLERTQSLFGHTVGKLYVERTFAGDSKEILLGMIGDLTAALIADLEELSWMDEATRQGAIRKLEATRYKVGYPDAWRDENTPPLNADRYFNNVLTAREATFGRWLDRIGRPLDRDAWRLTPQTLNAAYEPSSNEIVFPAGVLQPPLFHRDFPAAMSFGAIGVAIGHELTHGFDDQGRKFDDEGQLRDWWSPAASEKFQEKAQCVEDLYSGYEIEPGLAVDGKLTLGENLADIGGLHLAYDAFLRWRKRHGDNRDVSGLSDEQLFFVAFGQSACDLRSPALVRAWAKTDVHAPPRFRINGAVANTPAFGEAFHCAVGSPMRPQKICEVW